ncbi:MAG: SBBP repeat-containing protein [Sphingobacteriaceae bacterium]|nr:SBBP repeat-containing protein [Sphingobacteriaceae bacterium]
MRTPFKIFALTLTVVLFLRTEKSLAQTTTWQWAKSAGSTGYEAALGTAADNSGNLYVIGWYSSATITFGSITLTNPGVGTGDVFVVKFDGGGNPLWAKTFGGADGDVGNGIAVDALGNVYITGAFASSTISFGTSTLTNAGAGNDVFIVKLNSSGTEVWAKSAGGSSSDRGYGITVDPSGNVFTTGAFMSTTINFGTGALTNASATNDFFIAKHDSNGNALWAHNAGGTNADTGFSIASDSLGNAYATGAFASASIDFGIGALTNSTTGTQDIFVVKYDGLGNAVWSSRTGGTLDDAANGIAVKKNNVYITGGFSSASITFSATTLNNNSAGTSDVFLAKYDLGGNSLWANRAGDADAEAGNSVAIDESGNTFITGFFISSSISFGGNTLTNSGAGYRDLFVTAYSAVGNVAWAKTATAGTFDEVGNAIAVNSSGIYVGGMFNSSMVSFDANTVFKGCGDDVFVAKLLGTVSGVKEEYVENAPLVYPNPNEGNFTIEAEGQIIIYNSVGEIVLTEKSYNLPTGQADKTNFNLSSQAKGVYFYRVINEKKGVYTGRVIIK